MIPTDDWKSFFRNWPAGFPRNGVLLTNLNEAMPFRNFWLKDGLLMLERTVPDALGGRFLLLGFEVINSVKFISPLTEETIAKAGFAEPGMQELQAAY